MVKEKGLDELMLKHILDQMLAELKAIHMLLQAQNKEWIAPDG